MVNRSAHASSFGLDFQTNAGIFLMLEYIENMKSIKLEGDYEDIDIILSDGTHILAQAKSVENASNDFSNVRAYLKKGLITLSEGNSKTKASRLIYITNSSNPFKDEDSKRIFSYLPAIRKYNTLPESARLIIDDYLTSISKPLDKEKLYIQSLPFETDEDNERYKYVREKIDSFINDLNYTSSISGLSRKAFLVWNDKVFKNNTRKNTKLSLSKSEIIWALIVIAVEGDIKNKELYSEFEEDVVEEVEQRYLHFLSLSMCRFDFFTKVIYDYQKFKQKGNLNSKTMEFVKSCYEDYIEEFSMYGLSEEVKKALVQTVIYKIIMKRKVINELKQV